MGKNEIRLSTDVHPKQAGERYEERHRDRTGRAMETLDRMSGRHYQGEYELVGVKIRLGTTDKEETLVVVTAVDGQGGPVVCFSSAMTPSEALMGAINRIENGQAKWRHDEYRST